MAPTTTPPLRRLVVALSALTVVVAGCAEGSAADTEPRVDVAYATLDGGEANLAELRGRPVVLNFFAAWCTSCVSEMPRFEEAYRARGDEVTFLGMSEDLLASSAADLVVETGITYPTGWDPTGRVLNSFRTFGLPTTVFITADGRVAHTYLGALDRAELEDLIDEYLV